MNPSSTCSRLGVIADLALRFYGSYSCRRSAGSKLRPNAASIQCSLRVSRRPLTSAALRRVPARPEALQSSKTDSKVTEEEATEFEKALAQDKDKQIRRPWHRDGSDQPPVSRGRSAGAMTKGKLLTTPSRLLKLVLPLVTRDTNADRKSIEPLALLVHPQQPLSYLERLIQSELPILKVDGKEKIPNVDFWAIDAMDKESMEAEEAEELDKMRGGPGEGGVEAYSGLGRETPADQDPGEKNFVKWNKSTDIGDFIREAARGSEFAVDIEGAPNDIRVGVPSFKDRTYYLRIRLRKQGQQIAAMAHVKKECDLAAHRAAQRYVYAGFGAMMAWGIVVTWATFETSLGWDVMEPVTYLVGLAGFMGGYAWFMVNRREASYQSAMNLTVSRRQNKLYEQRGFDLSRWQYLVDENNRVRREILSIAAEYDVEWDEKKDIRSETASQAMKDERKSNNKKKKDEDTEEEEEEQSEKKSSQKAD